MSQPSSKIFYRCSEPELSKYAEDLIGHVERKSVRANLRADLTMKGQDYVSLNEDVRMTPLVLQTEIAGQPNFECYIAFRGNVAKGRPRFTRQIVRVPPYIARPRIAVLEPVNPNLRDPADPLAGFRTKQFREHRRALGVKHVEPGHSPPSASDNSSPSPDPWMTATGFAEPTVDPAAPGENRSHRRLSGRPSRSDRRREATEMLPFDGFHIDVAPEPGNARSMEETPDVGRDRGPETTEEDGDNPEAINPS